jgi:hypothetical protein
MKLIKIVGVCLAAMVAFGAIAASSAYAGEYGVCLKVAKSTGAWKDKGCEKEHTKGNYEWFPGLTGIGQKGVTKEDFEFTSTDKKAVFKVAAPAPVGPVIITCKKSKDAGEILGTQYNWETILFEDCTATVEKKVLPCNAWTNSRKIVNFPGILAFTDTYLIDHGTLGSEGLEPKELEVWNAYFYSEKYPAAYPYGLPAGALPEGTEPYEPAYVAEFDCAGWYFRIKGQASGVVTPVSKMTSKWNVEFAAGKGEQGLETEFSFGGVPPYMGPYATVLTDTLTNTTRDKSKIEIKDCNEPGAKDEEKGALPCLPEEPLPWGPLA